MEKTNFLNGALHFVNAERKDYDGTITVVYPDNPKRKERLFSIGGKSVCWDAAPMEFRKEYFPVYFDQFGRDFFPYVPAGE